MDQAKLALIKKYALAGGAVVLVGVLLFFGLRGSDKNEPSKNVLGDQTKPLVVAVSIFPIADITKNVVGDKAQVVTILPPGVSEHTYEPTPEAVRSVQGATLFLKVGFGLDDWTDVIAKSANSQATIKNVSGDIKLREFGLNEGENEKESGGSFDPHYFLTLENGALIAKTIADYVAEQDPKNASYYRESATLYGSELRREDKFIKDKLATIQSDKRSIATFHDAWRYFADHYGLKIAATFEEFPGKEPNPQYLADFIKTVKNQKIKVIFTEPQFSSESIGQVAEDLKITLAELDPIGGTTEKTSTFLDLIRYNADTIYKILSP